MLEFEMSYIFLLHLRWQIAEKDCVSGCVCHPLFSGSVFPRVRAVEAVTTVRVLQHSERL